MITSVFFPDSILMAPAMYFLGIAVIILAGIALKRQALLRVIRLLSSWSFRLTTSRP